MIQEIFNKMNFISPIFYQVLYLTIIGSIVGIIVYFIRNIFDRKISGKWKCIIWYIVLIALLVPIRIEVELQNPVMQNKIINKVEDIKYIADYESISEKQENINEKIPESNYKEIVSNSMLEMNSSKEQSSLDIKKATSIKSKTIILNIVLPYIWFLGTIAFTLTFFSGVKKINKRVSKNIYKDERLENILRECRMQLSIKKKVKIILQEYKKVPSIFGIINPSILITPKILQENNETIKYIFLHELSHYKRKDLLFNYILLFILSIHWFNPVVWFLFKKIRQDIEIGADELASRKLDINARKEYGMVLIKLLRNCVEENYTASMLCMSDTGKNMERRIHMIKRKSTSVILSIILLVIIAGVVTGVIFIKVVNTEELPLDNLLNQVSQSNNNEDNFENIESKNITDEEEQEVRNYTDKICNQFYTYTLPEFSNINNADKFWIYGHLSFKGDGFEGSILTKEEVEEQLKNIFGDELEIDVKKDLPEVDPILTSSEVYGIPDKYSLLITGDLILVRYIVSDIKKVDENYIVKVIEYTDSRDVQRNMDENTAVYAYEENDNQYMKDWKRIFSSDGMSEQAVKDIVWSRQNEFRAFNITLKKDNMGNLCVKEIKLDKKHNENMKNFENQKEVDRRANKPSYIIERGELDGNLELISLNGDYNYNLLDSDMIWNNESGLYHKIIMNMEEYNKYSSRIDIPKMVQSDFENYFLIVIANENLKPKNEVDLYVYDVICDDTTTHIIMKQKENPIIRNTSKNITNEQARVFESDNATFWAIIDKSKLKNNVDVIIEH